VNTARRAVFVALTVILVLSVMALSDTDDPARGLLSMLAQVPQEAVLEQQSGWAAVRYVDYEALAAAEGIGALRDLGDVDLVMTMVPISRIMGRIAVGPDPLRNVVLSAGQMADTVGFEWLVDVDRSLEFGEPPNPGLVLDGSFDHVAIGLALEDRGYDLSSVAGVPVWHRFDDYAISLGDRDMADPFGGHLGAAARVALLPDHLANARSWPLIEAIIAASLGETPSLADDVGYRALAEAISGPEGWLIEALFFAGEGPGQPSDPGGTASAQDTDEPRSLPPFSLVVLADRQEGGEQVHLVGLVCDDREDAEVAAEVLAERLEAFRQPSDAEESLAEQFGARIGSTVLPVKEKGTAVALVEARYPAPPSWDDPTADSFVPGGQLYRAWVQAIMRREFSPLW